MGNTHNVFVTIGASNHSQTDRETNDYYATDPKAAQFLISLGLLEKDTQIWECACGEGHLSKVFEENGYSVLSTDLINRGYGVSGVDFLDCTDTYDGNIVTNPPYKYALDFVEKAISLVPEGNIVAMFLRLTFLEGKRRGEFFTNNPPKVIYVTRSRIKCAKNADFASGGGSAVAYAWYIWEKGYKGDTVVRWFN